MSDLKARIAQAQPRSKSVALCLRGDLLADLAEAEANNDKGQVTALQAEVAEATVVVSLRGLSYGEYRRLENAHPDPKGDGWDADTFPPALVKAALIDVSPEDADLLLSTVTSGQMVELFTAALTVTNAVDAVPLPKRG